MTVRSSPPRARRFFPYKLPRKVPSGKDQLQGGSEETRAQREGSKLRHALKKRKNPQLGVFAPSQGDPRRSRGAGLYLVFAR
jgi:hypothetical protein